MSKQPEALRLADALDAGEHFYPESSFWFDSKLAESVGDAAAELRRLHAENTALKAKVATQRQPQPMPPVPLATLAEQQAFVFGWWRALETTHHMHDALQIIATPQRPDGTWNRDREACRQIAAEALGFHNKGAQE